MGVKNGILSGRYEQTSNETIILFWHNDRTSHHTRGVKIRNMRPSSDLPLPPRLSSTQFSVA